MELKINRWIFFGVIISSFFIQVIGRHIGGPWVLFEIFMIFNIPEILQRSDLITFIPVLSILTGQLLFLLGWRSVKNYKLWLFLCSPLFVLIPFIYFLSTLGRHQTPIARTVIPFILMVIIFYVHCFLRLRKNTSKTSIHQYVD